MNSVLLELLVGTFGWNFWLELLFGTFDWNFWLERLVGTFDWNVWLERFMSLRHSVTWAGLELEFNRLDWTQAGLDRAAAPRTRRAASPAPSPGPDVY